MKHCTSSCVFVPIIIAIHGFNRFCSVFENTVHTYIEIYRDFRSNFMSSRWNQWISRFRRNVNHSPFAIRMQPIWKLRFHTFRWYSFRWVFPGLKSIIIQISIFSNGSRLNISLKIITFESRDIFLESSIGDSKLNMLAHKAKSTIMTY